MSKRLLSSALSWDFSCECEAFAQGWELVDGIIRRERKSGTFRSDYDALQFVRGKADEGSSVAKKALKIHATTNTRRAATERKRLQRMRETGVQTANAA